MVHSVSLSLSAVEVQQRSCFLEGIMLLGATWEFLQLIFLGYKFLTAR